MPTKEELEKGFQIGEWEILPARGVFRRGDREERPEPKVFGVLMSLAMRDGDLVTRDELISEHWDGRPTSDEPINRSLSQLRGHLGDQERPHQYIETLTRRGYRLIQKVRLKEPLQVEHVLPETDSSPFSTRIVAAVAVAVVLGLLILGFVWNPFTPKTEPIRSIGVLPFDNIGGIEADEYLDYGFKEELVQTLRNIPDFLVKNGRIDYAKESTEIAEILKVDGLLSGTVQRNGDMLKISYQITDGRSGLNISSGSITGQLKEIFALQEKLARTVRNDLLGESLQQLVSSSRPANFGAYDSYLRGLYTLEHRGDQGNLEDAIELFRETISLDPQFGPAYLMLANAYALLTDYRAVPFDESQKMAIATVERGIAVDDSIRDAAGAVFGYFYHKQKNWAKSEQAFLRATHAEVVDSNAFNWYSRMLASVGRLDAALEQALAALEIDPSYSVINTRVATAYTWLGESAKAIEYYERSNQLGASGLTHLMPYALLLVREGQLEKARNLADSGISAAGGNTAWVDPVFDAFHDPLLRREALNAVDLASTEYQLDPQIEVTVRVLLGDIDGAMAVARLLERPGEAFEMDLLFIPEFLPLRQHPDFPDLMENLGLTAYWDGMGCIWRDAALNCPKAF